MIEKEHSRLTRIDQLLQDKNYADLEALTLHEIPRQLLSEEALDAARALKLPATVMYVATLAVENLPDAVSFAQWLAVYQSIARGTPTPALIELPTRHPLRAVALGLVEGQGPTASTLRKCAGGLPAWQQALELAFDHACFETVLDLLKALAHKKWDVRDWLRIAKVMINRQHAICKGQVDSHLGQAYLFIRAQLRSPLAGVSKARSTLALCASDSFFRSRNHAQSVEAARMATDPVDRARAAYEVSRALCHMGDALAAITSLDQLIALVLGDGGGGASDALATPDEATTNQDFDPEQAARALVDLQHALATVGQRAFLVSGTLLGYAREGKILDHDKDLDVGIIGWEGQYDVAQAIVRSGRFGIDMSRLRAEKTHHIPLQHLETRVAIDVFVYHREADQLVTGVESYFGYLQKFAFTPFELKSVAFLGVDFYVPEDIERNLAENFGDWRQPDPDYISHLESPSTVDVGGEVFQMVGRLRALEAVKAGKYERLARVIQIMERHQAAPGGMPAATLDLLRRHLAAHRPLAAPAVLEVA